MQATGFSFYSTSGVFWITSTPGFNYMPLLLPGQLDGASHSWLQLYVVTVAWTAGRCRAFQQLSWLQYYFCLFLLRCPLSAYVFWTLLYDLSGPNN
jgi:hypothetical protein